MAKRTIEQIECDVCGKEGERYIVIYPHSGQFILDRCARHNTKIMALQNEEGEWMKTRDQRRNSFQVSDPDELLREIGRKK